MTPPRVCILITAFNAQRYLDATLESARGQTLRDLQIIVVNDGSTDATAAILDRHARADARIQVITQENRGIPRSANQGLAHCTAPYVARLDSDDLALPNRMETQAAFLDAHPQVVCCGSDIGIIDAKGRFLTDWTLPRDDQGIQQKLLAGHCSVSHPACMIRRGALAQVGGYNEHFAMCEDLDLFLRLGEIGKLANIPQTLTHYRLHAGSISEQRCAQERELGRQAVEQASRRRGVTVNFEGHTLWRPGIDRASRHAFALQYGWWAFNSGQRRTALVYGCQAVGLQPHRVAGWKLMACAVLKSPPAAPASLASNLERV
jgi:glycosyltransferase involved in cell wall biosynthesis